MLSTRLHLEEAPPRGDSQKCREIFTLYAVEDRLGYVKNGREIVERKLNNLFFELCCR